MVNENLLKSAMIAKGFNIQEFARALGMSRQSLSYRLHGFRKFTNAEIIAAKSILELTDDQVREIFFADEVEERETSVAVVA